LSDFKSYNAPNTISAGAVPQSPVVELTSFSDS